MTALERAHYRAWWRHRFARLSLRLRATILSLGERRRSAALRPAALSVLTLDISGIRRSLASSKALRLCAGAWAGLAICSLRAAVIHLALSVFRYLQIFS